MTKEELEKEAYDYADKYWGASPCVIRALKETYINSAEPREKRITELEAQNKALKCCANCNNSYGGEEEPYHDCGYCHAMQCICKLKLEEHTSDIYRMWEDKCECWEMRVN